MEDRRADRLGRERHRGGLAGHPLDDRIVGHLQGACLAVRRGADRGQKAAVLRAGTFGLTEPNQPGAEHRAPTGAAVDPDAAWTC
jgi:hypothetical protein